VEIFVTFLTWIGYVFAVIGFAATVYKSAQAWLSTRTFDWKDVDKTAKRIIKRIRADGFYPDVIVSIGRGGSILGSILSGNLHDAKQCPASEVRNIPILGVDRIYDWHNGQRNEIENKMVDFSPLAGKAVLLVAADVLSGGTMKFFVKQIEAVQPAKLKTACLVKGITAPFRPDYVGREIPADFVMPWMYKGYGYVRDSRKPTGNGREKTA